MRAILILLLLAQDGIPTRVADELQKLRSDEVEMRADATRKLKALGEEARAGLETLSGDPDAEVRSRVLGLLRDLTQEARIRAVREPAKRVSVDLQDAAFLEGARVIFEPFGLKPVV